MRIRAVLVPPVLALICLLTGAGGAVADSPGAVPAIGSVGCGNDALTPLRALALVDLNRSVLGQCADADAHSIGSGI